MERVPWEDSVADSGLHTDMQHISDPALGTRSSWQENKIATGKEEFQLLYCDHIYFCLCETLTTKSSMVM